jgi:biuret amidohydrolase
VGTAFAHRNGDKRRLSVPNARPYPWPYDGEALAHHTALVVVAAQRAVASRCPGASAISETITALVGSLRSWGARVIWTRHARSPAKPWCSVLPPAHGPERGPFARQPDDLVALAYGVDGFSASPLAAGLRGYGTTHLIIAGFGLEGPVHSTLRTANDCGWECLLVPDACAPFDPNLGPGAVRSVEMSGGILGATTGSADLFKALGAKGAGGDVRAS